MGKLRIALLGAAAALALGGSASAADLLRPVPPPVLAPAPFTWSGIYLGVHGGYLWGHVDIDEDELQTAGTLDGFIGGVLGGINFQQGNLVYGLEADVGWTNATGHGGQVQDAVDIEDLFVYDLHWDAHFRGRLGVASGKALFFVAGGLALAGLDVSYEGLGSGGIFTGASIGGGIDYAFDRHLIARAEVLFDWYGDKSYSAPDFTAGFSATTVRAALTYKFD